MTSLVVSVIGTPVQQGSKVANRFGHGVRDSNDRKLRPWRAEVSGTVAETMVATGWQTLDGPIEISLAFFHTRPAAHYGTGRNAGVLKPSAPYWKSTAPDIDKLTRAILDALTDAAAIRDDARVARLVAEDRWADAAAGVRIVVAPLADPRPKPAASVAPAAGEPAQAEGALF
ncbi:RusA family crossover junction endodeoxyribonuclease [Pimelobacter simplex]|uniref:RusA family crossover junction endodeoxyribonuclease n=1 Tax=Nocardioides simplex TaxID=2045 RepID=UPI00215060D0|nr:RusA family crossover junction endodeoxyribonuclease [Pimelobacter simplex]UUW88440.1 RusA family crossover junction endodeoxyribonuclease [Pimelobacter simplex]UUW97944.1 RusA family crossover junction endodeoxyribonuclease [Pimelobacter simplex]